MFEIISDSPYQSKRSPLTGEQTKSVARAVQHGKKKPAPPKKGKPEKKKTQQCETNT